jgi:hypothetical protein
MRGQYILVDREPVPCDDLMEWARWFEQSNQRRVRLTRVGPYFVSTIFLGLDHNFHGVIPLLFETMAWIEQKEHSDAVTLPGDPPITFPALDSDRTFLDGQRRCSTWDEAEAQHQAVISELRQPGDELEELEVPAG